MMNKLIVMQSDEVEVLLEKMFSKYLSSDKKGLEGDKDEVISSIKELSKFINCSIGTAQKRKNDKVLRYTQHGRKIQFLKSEVLEDLKKYSEGDRKRKVK